ncbi:MAG: two-component system cell cycle sensor histidine kinase/response regulator CckA, partial [Planctomycetota bacterium]
MQTVKRPLIDSSGRCDHVLGVCVDITARKQAEDRERDLRESLARAQRLESLGVMAGGIAHDLNNILGPLVAYPDLIRTLVDDPKALDLVSDMEKAAGHATAIIQDMLTLARRGVYEFAPMSVNDIVSEYLELAAYRRLTQAHPEVVLTLDLAPDLPKALGSLPHYLQAVMNLITNAYEAVEGLGSVTIRTGVEQVPEHLTPFTTVNEGEYVFFEVTDSGVGINETDIHNIFEPFFSSKKLEGSGTGLARIIHEPRGKTPRIGSCWHFADTCPRRRPCKVVED